MAVDINVLLALPQKEKKKIAEQLWDSLLPNNAITKEDKATLDLLDKRWNDMQSGNASLYTPVEMKAIIAGHRRLK